MEALRTILGEDANDDAELRKQYILNEAELEAVITRFDVAFDPTKLQTEACDIFLFRPYGTAEVPYLIHTGYELPLLLDGRRKLARMSHAYPPMAFEGEDRFDHWVAQGLLHREEVIEPFDTFTKKWAGPRQVYCTPKGEEWRIPAQRRRQAGNEPSRSATPRSVARSEGSDPRLEPMHPEISRRGGPA